MATKDGQGYWLSSADGGVFTFGDAPFEGSLGALPLQGPIVAMAATADDQGYWLGALDGGVFALGDAHFYGSMGGTKLNQPIVGMAATPDGGGYWLVAADGGIFAFGDAHFYGSMGGTKLTSPSSAWRPPPTAAATGWWPPTEASSPSATPTSTARPPMTICPIPIVGMFASPDGGGYTMSTANGVVFAIGDAQSYGQLQLDPTATPISAIIGNNLGTGYWLLDPDAWQYSFTTPTPEGSFPGSSTIVSTGGLTN